MKAAWVNLILKITSLIQISKGKLLATHAFKSIFLVLFIISLEIVLSIISFPLYLVEATGAAPSVPTREYKTRRAITLGVVVTIAVVWALKLSLIVVGGFAFRNTTEIAIEKSTQTGTIEIDQDHILSIQQATKNGALSRPELKQVQRIPEKGMEFSGSAAPKTQVFVYLQRVNESLGEQERQTLSVVATESNESGEFRVTPDAGQFRFSPGKYRVEVVALDPQTQTFSEPSEGSIFTLQGNMFMPEQIIDTLDAVLNISLFVFIFVGVALTLLVT